MEGERRGGKVGGKIQWKPGKRGSGLVQKSFPGEKLLKFPCNLWLRAVKKPHKMRAAASQFGGWSFSAAEAGIQGSGRGREGGTGCAPLTPALSRGGGTDGLGRESFSSSEGPLWGVPLPPVLRPSRPALKGTLQPARSLGQSPRRRSATRRILRHSRAEHVRVLRRPGQPRPASRRARAATIVCFAQSDSAGIRPAAPRLAWARHSRRFPPPRDSRSPLPRLSARRLEGPLASWQLHHLGQLLGTEGGALQTEGFTGEGEAAKAPRGGRGGEKRAGPACFALPGSLSLSSPLLQHPSPRLASQTFPPFGGCHSPRP